MTIRKRLERLESQQPPPNDWPSIVMTRVDMSKDDVIGMRTGPGSVPVMRQPGEGYEQLANRASPLLATPCSGMPIIMSCVYSDAAHARVKEQTI